LFFSIFILIFFSIHSSGDGIRGIIGMKEISLQIQSLALIPAVFEEILMKGLIFTRLKKRYPPVAAVIITSLLFAVAHLAPIRIIPLFIFSCFTFWVYLRTGSLLFPIIIHFLNNFFTIVLITEPFADLAVFYSSLILFVIGFFILKAASSGGNKQHPPQV